MYAGTDDGSIHITFDGGKNWSKTEVHNFPDVPSTAFINDIKADLYDDNTVYVVLDNHKYGDFKPYVIKSTNHGKSWKSISNNLPENTLTWRIVQDHVKPELLFLGTEFGIYTSVDGGEEWYKLSGGIPTISFRDLVIQKRENDLVGASFGRSFFVLDDYSALREVNKQTFEDEATLFGLRDALLYIPRSSQTSGGKGSMGASYFTAPNPDFGAVFTYYLSDNYPTKKGERKKAEKALKKENSDIPFPGWESLDDELFEEKPMVILTIKDSEGNIVRSIKAKSGKGFHRMSWDLRYPSYQAISLQGTGVFEEFSSRSGFLVVPGAYTAELSKRIDGFTTVISEPVSFSVNLMQTGTLNGTPADEILTFGKEVNKLMMANSALNIVLGNTKRKVAALRKALVVVDIQNDSLFSMIYQVNRNLIDLERKLYGSKSKREVGEKNNPTISGRLWNAMGGVQNTTYGPTQTQIESYDIAKAEFSIVKYELEKIVNNQIPNLEKLTMEMGAPWIEGQPIPE